MSANPLVFGFVALALAFAGCTGTFDVKQTEPIMVQIDGEGEATRLAAGPADGDGAAESEFVIDNPDDVEVVTVVVQVTKVVVEDDDEAGDFGDDDEGNETGDDNDTGNESDNGSDDGAAPTIILVIVEDRDTGERLDEQRVEIRDDDSAQAELNINVKGKDNIVIVTQAVQGAADVTVSATQGSETGSGDVEMGDDEGAENNTTMPSE